MPAAGLEVWVGGGFLILSTTVPALIAGRRAKMAAVIAKEVSDTVGRSNGKGTMTQMSEALLASQENLATALTQHIRLDDERFLTVMDLVRSENEETRANTDAKAKTIIAGQTPQA